MIKNISKMMYQIRMLTLLINIKKFEILLNLEIQQKRILKLTSIK